MFSPILAGVFGPQALGGLLAGALITGVMLAIFMANAGGAWDNAKNILKKENIEERVRKHIRLLRLLIQSVITSGTPQVHH
mgnify:CR=1 FL=1